MSAPSFATHRTKAAIEGKLLVPNIGCSNCQSKDGEIALLKAKLQVVTNDLGHALEELQKLRGEKANRAIRRVEERSLRKKSRPRFAR